MVSRAGFLRSSHRSGKLRRFHANDSTNCLVLIVGLESSRRKVHTGQKDASQSRYQQSRLGTRRFPNSLRNMYVFWITLRLRDTNMLPGLGESAFIRMVRCLSFRNNFSLLNIILRTVKARVRTLMWNMYSTFHCLSLESRRRYSI
jgi:hypothetical protein